MAVRIITDSASDYMDKDENVTVIPMTIQFGDKTYKDGVDLTHDKFYELLIENEDLPTTSLISPAQFEEAFKEVKDAGDEAVVITVSSKLSGTFQSAMIAAQDFEDEIALVDSENVTIAEGLLVKRAVELAKEGKSAKEIKEILDKEKKDLVLIALLDTLEYLKKGGRVPKSVAMIGGLLSIKPVIGIEDGEVAMIGKARGSKNANNLLVQEVGKHAVDHSKPIVLGYTGLEHGLLDKYVEDSKILFGEEDLDIPVNSVGGTIGTHSGPGAIAVAYFAEEK